MLCYCPDAHARSAIQDKRQILEGCSTIVPSLKNAEVVADWAGLRPYRQRVRIELEHKQVFPAFLLVIMGFSMVSIGCSASS